MIKSLHLGRFIAHREDFDALVDFLQAIGLERVSGAENEHDRSANFAAPLGELSLHWSHLPPEFAETSAAADLLLEVTDVDTIFEIVQKRRLRIISDHSTEDGAARLFVVELPGGSHAAVLGIHGVEQPALAGSLIASGLRFAIVVARFNSFITERLLAGALDALRRAGAAENDSVVVRVPGAFEIPAAARTLAQTGEYDAIICIGCLLRGETLHYEVIANEVARGIGQSAQETRVPHAFGVLTCDTLEQAIDRAGLKAGNKGFEAALSAIEMARLKEAVSGETVADPRPSVVSERDAASLDRSGVNPQNATATTARSGVRSKRGRPRKK